MADNDKQYKAAMKSLDNLLKKQEAVKSSAEELKGSWSAIGTQLFQLSGAEFFKQVPLASGDVKRIQDEIGNLNKHVKVLGNEFGKVLDKDKAFEGLKANAESYFSDYMKGVKELEASGLKSSAAQFQAEKKMLKEFRSQRSELADLSDEDIKRVLQGLDAGRELSDIYDELSDKGKKTFESNADSAGELMKIRKRAEETVDKMSDLNKILEGGVKSVKSLSQAFSAFSANIVKRGIASLNMFDGVINDVQKRSGIEMDKNAEAFANLTRNVAEYGMSVENAGQMMSAMSDELNTTNFSLLSKATEDLAAVEGATGASLENITGISGQLMRMGKTSEEVKDYFDDASKMAQKFGVSSKRALDAIGRNIKKMREMGFVGGEKSLQKMVVTAERLNQNVDEIFDVAKRARTIEGAMEMASELQLAGGSFANINPMDLLAASRKGPEELQKILTQMGGDVGRFNKETGEYEFDPVDVDRLQMVADATGQTLDSVMNGIQKSGLDKQKLEPFSGMLDGLEEADKALLGSSISDMMKWDEEKGAFVLDAESDMAKRMGVDSMEELQAMSASDLKKKIEEDAKNLEEQNKRNQSFQKSLENFWNALQSVFYIFQPILEVLTTVLQSVTSAFIWVMKGIDSLGGFGSVIKWAIPLLLLFGTGFASSVWKFISEGMTKFGSNIKKLLTNPTSLFSKEVEGEAGKFKEMLPKTEGPAGPGQAGGGIVDGLKGKTPDVDGTTDLANKTEGPKKGVKEGLMGLADGLKAMGEKGVLKGIINTALAGPALLLMIPGMPTIFLMSVVGMMDKLIKRGFTAVAEGISAMGQAKGLVKGAIAMVLVGASIVPFAFALQMMSEVGWGTVLMAITMMAAGVLTLMGIGMIVAGPGGVALLLGALALVSVGVALMAFGASMMIFASASQAMQGMEFGWLGDLGWSMLVAAPGLLIGGFALALATPGLLIGSIGLLAIATALQSASAVDWGAVATLGITLMNIAPGLIAFGLSAMFFANPMTLLGIMMMTWALSDLVGVMTPLAQALSLGSESLNGFADGIQKLSSATGALSDEKLEKLQKISEAMAEASASGNIGAVMAAMEGGGSGGGGTKKIEIDLKLNGRMLQQVLVDDNKIIK